jgi:hypothetical protein
MLSAGGAICATFGVMPLLQGRVYRFAHMIEVEKGIKAIKMQPPGNPPLHS